MWSIVNAGLVDKLIDYHKMLMVDIYTNLLYIDLSVPENMMKLYTDMGSAVGMILYCMEQNFKADSKIIANILGNKLL